MWRAPLSLLSLSLLLLLLLLPPDAQSASCPEGTFGPICSLSCNACHPMSACEQTTDGGCTVGCVKGRQNFPLCNENCTNGCFGFNCSTPCNCQEQCEIHNGFCSAGCLPGWEGANCQDKVPNFSTSTTTVTSTPTNFATSSASTESSSESTQSSSTATTQSTQSSTASTASTPLSTASTASTPSSTASAGPSTDDATSSSTASSASTFTSASTAASTLESTAASTLESTAASTLESTAASTLESTAASTLESTVASTLESTEATEEPPTGHWALVLVVALVLLLLLLAAALLILLCLRRRQRRGRRLRKKCVEMVLSSPIELPTSWQFWTPVWLVNEHRRLLDVGETAKEAERAMAEEEEERGRPLSFADEFRHLSKEPTHPVARQSGETGRLGDRWPDNRVGACDACLVRGYVRRDAFISAKSPIDVESASQLWRLAIEWGTSQVVAMETAGYRYWPEAGESLDFGDVRVRCEETVVGRFSAVSSLTVNGGRVHLHRLTSRSPLAVSAVCTGVQVRRRIEHGPVLVHSSDPAGRACLLMALDWLAQQAAREGSVSPYKCCLRLRRQRPYAISAQRLYAELYDALFESVVCLRQRVLRTQNEAAEAVSLADKHWRVLAKIPPPAGERSDEEWPAVALAEEPKDPAEFWRSLPDVGVVVSAGSGLWRGEGHSEFQCGAGCSVVAVQQSSSDGNANFRELLIRRGDEQVQRVVLVLTGGMFGSSGTPKSAVRLRRLLAKAAAVSPRPDWLLVGPVDRCCLLAACLLAAEQIKREGFVDVIHLLRWMRLRRPATISSRRQLQFLLKTLHFGTKDSRDSTDLNSTYESVHAYCQLPVALADSNRLDSNTL